MPLVTITGTCHFVSLDAAIRYYKSTDDVTSVLTKLAEKSIHIGPPEMKPDETLQLIDRGTRYAIVTGRSKPCELLKTIARQLAEPLAAEGWTLTPDIQEIHTDYKTFTKDGMRFALGIDRSKPGGRLTVRAFNWPSYTTVDKHNPGHDQKTTVWPNELQGDDKREVPSITITVDKTREQMAKEIRRRFLDLYATVYAKCKAFADNQQRIEEERHAAWQEVCRVIDADPLRRSHYVKIKENENLVVENSCGKAYVELYLDATQLTALLKLLRS